MEHGNLLVLLQPAEFLIICGAAIGSVLVSTPVERMKMVLRSLLTLTRGHSPSPQRFRNMLKMMYELFTYARRAGLQALETEVEQPEQSLVLKGYPDFLKDITCRAFLCDSLRMYITAGVKPEELDRLMNLDMRVVRATNNKPVRLLGHVADSLPGLGIVAAVLGVVVTMQSLGGDVSQVGAKVAAALVGTFLGILLCYGVVGPLALHLEVRNEYQAEALQTLRVAITSYLVTSSARLACEYARRSIPLDVRPTFDEMEEVFRREARIPATSRDQGMAASA